MIDIRQPNIMGGSEAEQLNQMKSYLYQLAQQLQWAFSTLPDSGQTGQSQTATITTGLGNAAADPVNTFNGIKNLIIKSSQIVDAYYQEINGRLEQIYVAQSDFGTYSQQTSKEIQENATNIQQVYTNLQEISNTVDQLYNASISTNAYIKSGLLYYDKNGVPVYGLEIGQTNNVGGVDVFDKFARFSSDRLSFFDSNDTEVAYISDYKLYITNAEITGELTLMNRFKVTYSNGLAFQWIGG